MHNARQKLEQTAWFAVVDAYEKCGRQYAAMLSELSLTVAQYDALNVIRTLGDDATPRAIADRLLVTRGNVTGLLKRLQDHGLVTTRPHPEDARSFLCALTEGAHERLKRADRAANTFIRQQLAPFSDAALNIMTRDMRHMSSHLDTLNPTSIATDAIRET
ncbi:MAG: MarR family transcriptional regulator [Pseudomonadota bacterium]